MFSKSFAPIFALAVALQVHGHALIEPAIGVTGAGARNDVQTPSTTKPCGDVNVAAAVGASTPVVAAADGSFTVTVQNFNGGADGSRQVTATVDTTGRGAKFSGAIKITQNGDPAPAAAGSQQVKGSLPAGTTCTGGSDKKSCLVAFKTPQFGNCVLVSQVGRAGAGPAANAANNDAAAGAKGKGKGKRQSPDPHSADEFIVGSELEARDEVVNDPTAPRQFTTAAGTRAARALQVDLESRAEETQEAARRNLLSWIWA